MYLLNIIPSQSLDNETPHTIVAKALDWDVKAPCVANLRTYSYIEYVHDDEVRRSDKSTGEPNHYIDVQSDTLWDTLRTILGNVSGVSFKEEKPTAHASSRDNSNNPLTWLQIERTILFHHIDELEAYILSPIVDTSRKESVNLLVQYIQSAFDQDNIERESNSLHTNFERDSISSSVLISC